MGLALEVHYVMTWPTKKLGEVCEIVTGSTPKTSMSSFYGGNILWAGPSDLNGEIYVKETQKKITQKGVENGGARLIPKSAVMVSCIGHIGKIGIASEGMATNQQINSFFPKDKNLDSKYLYYSLVFSKDKFIQQSSQTTLPIINKGKCAQIEISLPPLSEQKKIVARLEKVLAKVKEAKRLRAEALELTQNLLSAELHKIFEEGSYKEKIKSFSSLINGRGFKTSEWTNETKDSLPIIRIQNLNSANKGFNNYKGDYDEKILINPGDLLFSWSGSKGTSFGPHIWGGPRGLLNQHIFKIEHNEKKIDKMYFYFAMKHLVIEVENNLHGGVGLVHITKTKFENLSINLPSLIEQKKIVARLDALQEKIQKLQEHQKSTLSDLNRLEQSILHNAFSQKI